MTVIPAGDLPEGQLPDAAQRIAVARSFLFVPGDRPDRVRKALDAGADAIIIDLEDAVRSDARPFARSVVRDLAGDLGDSSPSLILVRVNPHGSADFTEDVTAALDSRVDGVVMPKFVAGDSASEMDAAITALEAGRDRVHPIPVIGLVESAAGLLALSASGGLPPRVVRLAFGAADFYADLRMSYQQAGIYTDLVMTSLVVASAAAGLPTPLDSPHFSISDEAGLVAAVGRARERGFGGALCIHPNQVSIVNTGFAATAEELAWAAKVLAAWGDPSASTAGAIRVGDDLIDEAMVRRARQIADQSGATRGDRR
jgi:citrate lyase subunit beta/citryl-CoA lyase